MVFMTCCCNWGDLTRDEIIERGGSKTEAGPSTETLSEWITQLQVERRIVEVTIAGEPRWIAAEDTGVYRDALGIAPPLGLPLSFLEMVDDPWASLILRFAKTHVPFTVPELAARFGVGDATMRMVLGQLTARDELLEGEFLPRGRQREWCDAGVLRKIKRRSLARLREQIEPVSPARFTEFLTQWHDLDRRRRGLDGLLDTIEQLQGLPLPFSDLEEQILPARVEEFKRSDLDQLCAAGEIVWRGCQPLGVSDGYVALYLTDAASMLITPIEPIAAERVLDRQLFELLSERGALFFDAMLQITGAFKKDVADALWRLVWSGHVTNDTLAPLRSLARTRTSSSRDRQRPRVRGFRSRRSARVAGAEGRWTVAPNATRDTAPHTTRTERQTALAKQLLERYGVVTREIVRHEGILGGFAGLYPVFKQMEETGRVRRGYFIEGQGGAQFAAPGADDRLRSDASFINESRPPVVLASADPANPYGASVAWPELEDDAARPRRTTGTKVILHEGALVGYLSKNGSMLTTFLDNVDRQIAVSAIVTALSGLADHASPIYLQTIDGRPVGDSELAEPLKAAGFGAYSQGFLKRATR